MTIDFSQFETYFTPVVVIACLIVGYILKNSIKCVPNNYIPTILAIFGCAINPLVCGLSVETIVYGALMGLASTGLHQAFTRFIEGSTSEPEE